jgi:small subunit ribosomal protein S9
MYDSSVLIEATGKRKTSVAKIYLKEGTGKISINNLPFDQTFQYLGDEKEKIKKPLIFLNLSSRYDIDIKVKGGGFSGQTEAIQLALAKALCKANIAYRLPLHQALFLRRDARIKERRKYGLRKARKAPQYSKR